MDSNGMVHRLQMTHIQLRDHARWLAESLKVGLGNGRDLLLPRLTQNEAVLTNSYKIVENSARQRQNLVPAATWLLDNFYVIEEQIWIAKQHFPRSYSVQLPSIIEGTLAGYPRVYAIVSEIIQHSDGLVDEACIKNFTEGYQEHLTLKIGELWAIPVMLRFALIQSCRQIAARIATAAIDRHNASYWVEKFAKTQNDKPEDALKIMADLTASRPRMSHVFIAEFARKIQSIYPPPTFPLSWLHQFLAHDGKSLESIFLNESQQESADQVSMSHAIGSLRNIESIDWRSFVEDQSVSHKILAKDPTGLFSKMDFATRDRYRHSVEKLARQFKYSEEQIAELAFKLSQNAGSRSASLKESHVGYYLIDVGLDFLKKNLANNQSSTNGERIFRNFRKYIYFLAMVSLSLLIAGVTILTVTDPEIEQRVLMLHIILTLLIASQAAISMVNWVATIVIKPLRIARMDYSDGIPDERATLVTIPTMLCSPSAIENIIRSLEINYLGNRRKNIYFALLTDFVDAKIAKCPEDDALVNLATEGIQNLNKKFAADGIAPFYLFHRPRRWNPTERLWMGYERKRGKLMELCQLVRGKTSPQFDTIIGDLKIVSKIKYIITLDTDTRLPHNAATELIAAMAHPLNEPKIDNKKKRVTEGYTIMQPRVSVELQSANKTWFSKIFAGEPGIDPYTREISDVYQDLFGEGSFVGKGIFEVDTFLATLENRFPENWVLSHDLIESCIARSALITDVILHEEFPAHLQTDLSRRHRWIRGDWQISPWLFPFAPSSEGTFQPSRLSGLGRWKIIDNLRRSLVPPAMLALLILGFLYTGNVTPWIYFIMTIAFVPTILTGISKIISISKGLDLTAYAMQSLKDVLFSGAQSVLTLIFMPYEAYKNTDAIIRSLFRMTVGKRKLLEWRSAHDVENAVDGTLFGYFRHFAPVFLLSAVTLVLGAAKGWMDISSVVCLLIWTLAPAIAWWISKPIPKQDIRLSDEDVAFLKKTAQDTWRYFQKYVNATGHWLPPDNVQINSEEIIAYRTSPTNIGLYLLSALAAYDFGFIDLDELTTSYLKTLNTLERLERHRGHFLNWYDTKTLQPLSPMYVSTVDSGNLTACLFTIATALSQICDVPQSTIHSESREALRDISQRMKDLGTCDYSFLYNKSRRLLAIGFNVHEQRTDAGFYDLLASESRLASLFGIALGQLPLDHWYALGRLMNSVGGQRVLLSWSGSMFEYLMPNLILPDYDDTLLAETHKAAVKCQIDYGNLRGVPWGFSESGYFATDIQNNYQYRAFGVPGLGFKRGLGNDLVVAPYASMLAIMVNPVAATANLRRLKDLGFYGECGYYEAIDFTVGRIPPNQPHAVVRSFMAHHQGMGFLALAHFLLDRPMQKRIIGSPLFQSVLILLEEMKPKAAAFPLYGTEAPEDLPSSADIEGSVRVLSDPSPAEPDVQLLSNGRYHLMIGASGESISKIGDVAVNRYRQDPLDKTQGLFCYFRDTSTNLVWTNSLQPSCVLPTSYTAIFTDSKAEFKRRDGNIETHTEVSVSPEHDLEIRRIHVRNRGVVATQIEVTSFSEIALANLSEAEAHPAFSNLFLKTEIIQADKAIICSRRVRSEAARFPTLFHTMCVHGIEASEATYETDRMAFLGRGRDKRNPFALESRLTNKDGHVLDPIFSIRKTVTIKPFETITIDLLVGAADDRPHALNLIASFREKTAADRIFDVAWTHSQVALQQLNIRPPQAQLFNRLAGYLTYPQPSLKQTAKPSISGRLRNQSGLWGFGISGDLSILLLRVSMQVHLPLVRELITAHNYLRRRGLPTDLVILNEDESSYRQTLQDEIVSQISHLAHGRHGASNGGIFLIRPEQIQEEDRLLLANSATVTFKAQDGATLSEQMKRTPLKFDKQMRPRPRVKPARVERPRVVKKLTKPVLCPDGTEIQIPWNSACQTPLPWVNVIANPNLGTIVSERGAAYTWYANAQTFRITPWYNDPASDPAGEGYYIQDVKTGQFWSPTPWPVEGENEYNVRHGFGYSVFEHRTAGILSETWIYVDEENPVKYVMLRIKNESNKRRSLSIFGVCEWVLGTTRKNTRNHIITTIENGIIYARNPYLLDNNEYTAFFSCREATSWTTDRRDFLGDFGDWRNPEALRRPSFSGQSNSSLDPCAALRVSIDLGPGAAHEIVFTMGAAPNFERARDLAKTATNLRPPAKVLRTTITSWRKRLTQISVKTPDSQLNALANGWLLYQTFSSRLFARSGFYQSGGAYGFRDQLQDVMAILHCEPGFARTHILKCAEHQFPEGDVLHWWHPNSERGVRTMFSDDYLWLPFVVTHYVQRTDDWSLLDERRFFVEGRPLKEGEESYYDKVTVSEKSGTVYDHCLASIHRALRFGRHGLPLMGCGDWNDGMNQVGIHGQGESVWLGFFLYEVLRQFTKLATSKRDFLTEKLCKDQMRRLADNLNRHAWDGEWYLRAYFDDGQPLGSKLNSDCKIDSLPQSWSIISTAGDPEKSRLAMRSVEEYLINKRDGLIRLFTPPFETTHLNPGYIKGYPPGVRENGGQYTHAAIWVILGLARLGDYQKAWELLDMINPLKKGLSPTGMAIYQGEPYVVAADVYADPPYTGRAGWTWYTGAAGWMYQLIIDELMGLQRIGNRLKLEPKLHPDWEFCDIRYQFGTSAYIIHISRLAGITAPTVTVDGKPLSDSIIDLIDDHTEHKVCLSIP